MCGSLFAAILYETVLSHGVSLNRLKAWLTSPDFDREVDYSARNQVPIGNQCHVDMLSKDLAVKFFFSLNNVSLNNYCLVPSYCVTVLKPIEAYTPTA
ncbi:unnamed protein product [Trichobilharzia regenti]|nr:unnamed protein product [Trichobilharzia regenti]